MATQTEVENILISLADAYPDWKPPSIIAVFKQYHDALNRYPTDLLQRAVLRCRDTCVYFPKIAEIKKAIADIRAGESPRYEPADLSKAVPCPPEVQKKMDELRANWVKTGKIKDGRQHAHNSHK